MRLPKVDDRIDLARSVRCSESWLICERWCLGVSSECWESALQIIFFVATGTSYCQWHVAGVIVRLLVSGY